MTRLVNIGDQRYVNPDAVLWVEWYEFKSGGPPRVILHLADGNPLELEAPVRKILDALRGED